MKIENVNRFISSYKDAFVPIILGNNINSLGISRSLGENKIKSIVIDKTKGIVSYSKYSISIAYKYEKESELMSFLIDIKEILARNNKNGIIFCSTDYYLMFLANNYNIMTENYILTTNSYEKTIKVLDKSFLYTEAEKLSIPYPRTMIAHGVDKVRGIIENIGLPILIKPSITVGFSDVFQKAIIINDWDEYTLFINSIYRYKLEERDLIIQEIIPGPISNLYTFTSFSSDNGTVLSYSIGHKIRQTPPNTGTITSGHVINDDKLSILAKKFIEGIKIGGISNTEFKLDTRDNTFKLIEINPRPGLWNYSATAAGINISYDAYIYLTTGQIPKLEKSYTEIIWVYDFVDMWRAVFSKKYGHEAFHISIFAWIKSLRGKKTHAIWNYKDPIPLVYLFLSPIIKRIRKGNN